MATRGIPRTGGGDVIVKQLENDVGTERVQIVRRDDGRYSYRRVWRYEGEWGKPRPDAGIYDDAVIAETEAMVRIEWLGSRRQ